MRLAAVLAAPFLAGCVAAPVSCPPLRAYTAAEQQALAAELPKDGTQAQRWIEDYVDLREACKAEGIK